MRPVGAEWLAVGRVPSWIAKLVGSKALRIASAQATGVLRLSAKLLPRLKTSEATVSLALILPKVATKEAKTKVSYVYTTKDDKLNPVEGRTALELPYTSLFIDQVPWLVQLPAQYEATALEGNIVIETGDAHGQPICLSKQIYDDEVPR